MSEIRVHSSSFLKTSLWKRKSDAVSRRTEEVERELSGLAWFSATQLLKECHVTRAVSASGSEETPSSCYKHSDVISFAISIF